MDASLASQARILMNSLTSRFNQLSVVSKPLAERMVNGAAQAGGYRCHVSLKQLSGGLSLPTGIVPEGMEDVAAASVAENVSLIKSIPQQYFKDITGSVMRSITTGNGLAEPADINKYAGQTKRCLRGRRCGNEDHRSGARRRPAQVHCAADSAQPRIGLQRSRLVPLPFDCGRGWPPAGQTPRCAQPARAAPARCDAGGDSLRKLSLNGKS